MTTDLLTFGHKNNHSQNMHTIAQIITSKVKIKDSLIADGDG